MTCIERRARKRNDSDPDRQNESKEKRRKIIRAKIASGKSRHAAADRKRDPTMSIADNRRSPRYHVP